MREQIRSRPGELEVLHLHFVSPKFAVQNASRLAYYYYFFEIGTNSSKYHHFII